MNERASRWSAGETMPSTTGRGDSSMHRGLEIINLIREDRPRIRIDDITTHIGCSKASAYRYLEVLNSVGLVTALGAGYFGIGPRVVELDRILQRTDPMVRCSRGIMRDLAAAETNSVVRLCSLQGETVICLQAEGSDIITAGGEMVELVYERGVTVSLFQNAAALAILAFLPPSRAQSIYLENAGQILDAGLGATFSAFRSNLGNLRQQGFTSTVGRNNPALAAVSVPVSLPEGVQRYCSLSRVFPRDWLERRSIESLVPELKEGSRVIAASMSEMLE